MEQILHFNEDMIVKTFFRESLRDCSLHAEEREHLLKNQHRWRFPQGFPKKPPHQQTAHQTRPRPN
jgi:hypothetical protein